MSMARIAAGAFGWGGGSAGGVCAFFSASAGAASAAAGGTDCGVVEASIVKPGDPGVPLGRPSGATASEDGGSAFDMSYSLSVMQAREGVAIPAPAPGR